MKLFFIYAFAIPAVVGFPVPPSQNTCPSGFVDSITQVKYITTSADGAWSVFVADMDGDGDLDIVSASYNDDTIAWYANDGNAATWTAYDIATTANGAQSVFVADMDGDGDMDIVSASGNDNTIAWYENNGNAATWTAYDIATSAGGAISVFVADMDGDGDMDIVSASYNHNTIAWYENNGNANPNWAAVNIATSAAGASSVFVADMDGDGDMDIVSASSSDSTIAWYANDGNANPTWTKADIATSADGASSVFVADMDGDGDMDIVSASFRDNTIAWYENNGNAATWTAYDITTSAVGAISVFVADIDGDEDMDIVSASFKDDTIAWYENDGNANPTWTKVDIATSADGATSVFVADMDGDGDMDIVSASSGDDTIAWYENDGVYACTANDCTASSVSSKDGSDGEFFCINGGTIGGTTGSCTCHSCDAWYNGASCQTSATLCTASSDSSKDGSDGEFYCINGGTIGGFTGSCSCTSCNAGYSGSSCQTASASCSLSDGLQCSDAELIKIKRLYNKHPNRKCGN